MDTKKRIKLFVIVTGLYYISGEDYWFRFSNVSSKEDCKIKCYDNNWETPSILGGMSYNVVKNICTCYSWLATDRTNFFENLTSLDLKDIYGFWRNNSSEFDYYIPNRYSVPFSKIVPFIIRYPANVLESQNISVYAIDNLNNSDYTSSRFSLAIQKITNEGVGLSDLNPTYSHATYSSNSFYLPKNYWNFSNALHLELPNRFNAYPGSFKILFEVIDLLKYEPLWLVILKESENEIEVFLIVIEIAYPEVTRDLRVQANVNDSQTVESRSFFNVDLIISSKIMYSVDNITCVIKSSDALMINKVNLSFEKICFDQNIRIELKEVIFEFSRCTVFTFSTYYTFISYTTAVIDLNLRWSAYIHGKSFQKSYIRQIKKEPTPFASVAIASYNSSIFYCCRRNEKLWCGGYDDSITQHYVYPAKNFEKFGFFSDGYVYGKTNEGSYLKLRQKKYYNVPIETWLSVEISLAVAKFYDRYTIFDYVNAFTLESGKAYSVSKSGLFESLTKKYIIYWPKI